MKKTVVSLAAALGLVAAVAAVAETPAPADSSPYPDTVTIDVLSHWFAPVEFAHSDHVDAVEDCSACHHDQEPEDIAACDECHSVGFDPTEPETPDLKMAFHLRCVGCHQQEDGSLACVDCHARQALPDGPPLKDAEIK